MGAQVHTPERVKMFDEAVAMTQDVQKTREARREMRRARIHPERIAEGEGRPTEESIRKALDEAAAREAIKARLQPQLTEAEQVRMGTCLLRGLAWWFAFRGVHAMMLGG
jgi:hypothetical protein